MWGSKQDYQQYMASGNACPLKRDKQPMMLSATHLLPASVAITSIPGPCMCGPWIVRRLCMPFFFIYTHGMSLLINIYSYDSDRLLNK